MISNKWPGLFRSMIGGVELGLGIATADPMLIIGGSAQVISGVGSMMMGGNLNHFGVAQRNPNAPYNVVYGRAKVDKPTLVYAHTWGTESQMLDLVFILACHPCESVDTFMMDGQALTINTSQVPYYPGGGRTPVPVAANSGTSGAQTIVTTQIQSISRSVNGIVTVTLDSNIPWLVAGQQVAVQKVNGGSSSSLDQSFNGVFQIAEILVQETGSLIFTYLSGGLPSTVTAPDNAGQITPLFPNYGTNVYVEYLLGNQTLGETFAGMQYGTPWQGSGQTVTPLSPGPAGVTLPASFGFVLNPIWVNLINDIFSSSQPNPWDTTLTSCNSSLVGKTCAFVRLQYSQNLFPNGIPMMSWILRGVNDIYDPDTGGTGYSENAALVVGHYLTNTVWGYGGSGTNGLKYGPGPLWQTGNIFAQGQMSLGSDGVNYQSLVNSNAVNPSGGGSSDWVAVPYGNIPIPALVAAKNLCAETVEATYAPAYNGYASGTEARYALNGNFDLSRTRGEILQNLLTSMAGRIVVSQGLYYIYPAPGPGALTPTATLNVQSMAVGPISWKLNSIHELYNGAKGTYVNSDNKWIVSDTPYYAQDILHGYNPLSAVSWLSGTAFDVGDYAVYDLDDELICFICLVANTGQVPSLTSTYWAVASPGTDRNVLVEGERRWLNLTFPFTTSSPTSQRLEKIELMRRRQIGSGTFVLNMTAYQCMPLDIISVTAPFFNQSGSTYMSSKLLEVQAVRLRSDKQSDGAVALSCELDCLSIDASVYDWSTLEELTPFGYQQTNWPTGPLLDKDPLPWSPGQVVPLSGDVYEGSAANFGIMPVYSSDAAGNPNVSLQIIGYPPTNNLSVTISPPYITASAGTGGSLPVGSYVIGLSARDSGSSTYKITPLYNLTSVAYIVIPAAGGSITIDILWGSGDTGGDLWMGYYNEDGNDVLHFQQFVDGSLATVTINSFNQSTNGGPDPEYDHLQIIANQIRHGGVWAEQVFSVPSSTTIVFNDNGGSTGTTANQFAGYVLSLYSKFNPFVPVPVLNLPILSNTASVDLGGGLGPQFVITIGPNSLGHTINLDTVIAVVEGVNIHLVDVFDVMVCRFNATFKQQGVGGATVSSFTDLQLLNSYSPTGIFGDLAPGLVAMVITGIDAGDTQTIAAVSSSTGSMTTADTFVLSGKWAVTPNTGDQVIIIDPTVQPVITGPAQSITESMSQIVSTPSVINEEGGQWIFTVLTCDVNGNSGPPALAPKRQYYIFGNGVTRVIFGNTTELYNDGRIEVGSPTAPLTGDVVITLLPEALQEQVWLTIIKMDTSAYTVTVNTYVNPLTMVADTFADGSTSFTLVSQGDVRLLKF